jgi:hypothetical protein
MILTIHNLAENYKCLPSQVLANASTFDLYVLDVHTKWLKYQHQKLENERANPNAPKTPLMTRAEMKAMIDKARSDG